MAGNFIKRLLMGKGGRNLEAKSRKMRRKEEER